MTEVSPCEFCVQLSLQLSHMQEDMDKLQALLREARSYVYYSDCPNQAAYDEQQALLEKIDEIAPEPPTTPREICGKEVTPGSPCLNDKGHEGECDDIPY